MANAGFMPTFLDVFSTVVVFDILWQSAPQVIDIFAVDFGVCDTGFEETRLNAEDFDTKGSHREPEKSLSFLSTL